MRADALPSPRGTPQHGLSISWRFEAWPLAEAFVISRGAKTEAIVCVVEVSHGPVMGRGESVPYARYGETNDSVSGQLARAREALCGCDARAARLALQSLLPGGAARNALDCALWELEAKTLGTRVHDLLGGTPEAILTAYTLSLDAPDAMAAKAKSVPQLPLLKLKLGGTGDDARMRAVRAARPDARLIADANEAWTDDLLSPLLAVALEIHVEVVEQPLPSHDDRALADRPGGVLICADESLHTRADLPRLAQRYDAVNVKLDKAGGLTEALELVTAARELGLEIMVGCMVATSLAMAPALMLGPHARWIDLDGPLLLARDRVPGLAIKNGIISAAPLGLWG
jgi:L-Ala-D/L-Glu epimerase